MIHTMSHKTLYGLLITCLECDRMQLWFIIYSPYYDDYVDVEVDEGLNADGTDTGELTS